MSYSVVFTPQAEEDFIQQILFHEGKKEGLGRRFRTLVQERTNLLSINPGLFAINQWLPKEREIRSVRVKPFDDLIFYKIYPNRVLILRVLGGSTDYRKWPEMMIPPED